VGNDEKIFKMNFINLYGPLLLVKSAFGQVPLCFPVAAITHRCVGWKMQFSFNGNCFNKLKSNNKIRDIEMFKANTHTRLSNPECFFGKTMTNGNYLLEIDVHECSNEITLTEDYLIKYTANINDFAENEVIRFDQIFSQDFSCTYRIGHEDSFGITPAELYNQNIQFMSIQDPEASLKNKMICSAFNETAGDWRILDPEVEDSHILPLGTLFKAEFELEVETDFKIDSCAAGRTAEEAENGIRFPNATNSRCLRMVEDGCRHIQSEEAKVKSLSISEREIIFELFTFADSDVFFLACEIHLCQDQYCSMPTRSQCNTQPPYGNNRMFEDLLRNQRIQRSQNSKARQIILSQIQTQNPPESRSTIELKVIIDDPYSTTKVGDTSILQSNQGGPSTIRGVYGSMYTKLPDTVTTEAFIPEGSDFGKNRSRNLYCQIELLLILSLLILFL